MLLLTGPSGSGKTACVKTLSRDMSFELQEWINPLTSDRNSTAWEDSTSVYIIGMGWYGWCQEHQNTVMRFYNHYFACKHKKMSFNRRKS